MSKTAKIVVWVIVAVVVIGGIWYIAGNQGGNGGYSYNSPAGTTNGTGSNGTNVASNNNSDPAIAQSLTNVDAQMNGLSSDSASVDQSMNDQPVPQQQL